MQAGALCQMLERHGVRGIGQGFSVRGKETKGRTGSLRKVVDVLANIELFEEVSSVLDNGGEGVGLYRTEYSYLNRLTLPTEEELVEEYRDLASILYPRKVVLRTLDVGADKFMAHFGQLDESNPALGLRAIRFCLHHRELFKTQLRALYRASIYGNLGVMFPMITSLRELQDAKAVLEECKAELTAEGKKFSDKIEVGTMIETPAAVLVADDLAQECDFFSIGTNDLTQYTCALDRQNAKLEPFFDPHHPAVLKAIRMTIEAGHRHGIWVGICGELGADTALTETFLRMGVDELSMNAKSILPVRKIIRGVDLSKPSAKNV